MSPKSSPGEHPDASVLLLPGAPTPLVEAALFSARSQSVRALEIIVLSEGPGTCTAVEGRPQLRDPRVRQLATTSPEPLREALTVSRGQSIYLLSADELWLPRHIETLAPRVQEFGIVHAQFVNAMPGGQLEAAPVDLGITELQEPLLTPDGALPTGVWAFSRDVLEQLLTPGSSSELYRSREGRLRHILEAGRMIGSTREPTVLHFSRSARLGWSSPYLSGERQGWRARLEAEGGAQALDAQLQHAVLTHHARVALELKALQETHSRLRQRLEERVEQLQEDYRILEADNRLLQAERRELARRVAALEETPRRVGI